MSDGEPPSGDRPRWSFTWLLRIQRHGRRDPATERGRTLRWGFVALIGVVVLIEIVIGLWYGVLPR